MPRDRHQVGRVAWPGSSRGQSSSIFGPTSKRFRELPAGFLEGVTFQALRRSCATHMQHSGSVKDIQAHLRDARPNVTASVYMQEIPASVRMAVESLDKKLCGQSDDKRAVQLTPN